MRNTSFMKKFVCSLLLIIMAFSFSTIDVYAQWLGNPSGGKPIPPSHGPYSPSRPGSPYASCDSHNNSTYSGVGFLVTLIRYTNDDGPNEVTVKKLIYSDNLNNRIKAKKVTFTEECADEMGKVKLTGPSGCSSKTSTNSVTKVIRRDTYEINWGKASPTGDASEVSVFRTGPMPDNMNSDLSGFVNGTLLPTLFPDADLEAFLSNVEDTFGLSRGSINRAHPEQYYLKVEPMYRKLGPLKKDSDPQWKEATHSSENLTEKSSDQYVNTPDPKWTSYTNRYTTCKACKDANKGYNDGCDDYKVAGVKYYRCKKNGTKKEYCDIPYTLNTNHYYYGRKLNNPDYPTTSSEPYRPGGINNSNSNNVYGTARDLGHNVHVLYNLADKNDHPAGDENAKEAGTDYYIGTTHENAIMASSSMGTHRFNSKFNKYKFYNESKSDSQGRAFYNILDEREDPCTSVCANAMQGGERKGDKYLSCASNFCDAKRDFSSQSASISKRKCILDECLYKPEKPIDCDNNDLTYESDVTQNGAADGKTISTFCGYTNKNMNKSSTELNGAYTFCERVGDAKKETDEKYNYIYTYSDTNTYLNYACKEFSNYAFKDLYNTTLQRGGPFDYHTIMYGNRECTIFFDYAMWKFDFAAIHALDDTRKIMMLDKIDAFNMISSGKDYNGNQRDIKKVTINGSELFGKHIVDEDGNKMTLNELEEVTTGSFPKVKSFKYSTAEGKAVASSVVTEVIDNSNSTEGMEPYGGIAKLDIVDQKTSNSFSSKGKDTVQLIPDYDRTKRKVKSNNSTTKVYRYVSEGSTTITFNLPTTCVTDDGLARVFLADESGNCVSTVGRDATAGKRLYHTSFKATPNSEISGGLEHHIETTVATKKTLLDDNLGAEFISGSDQCPYKVESGSVDCDIQIYDEGTGSPASQTCSGLYVTSSGLKAKLSINRRLTENEKVTGYGLAQVKDYKTTPVNSKSEIDIKIENLKLEDYGNKTKKAKVSILLEGVVETTSSTGDTKFYYCNKKIKAFKDSPNACTIVKNGDDYEIKGASGTVYAGTSLQRAEDGSIIMQKVEPDKYGRYMYRYFPEKPTDEMVIYARVGTKTCYLEQNVNCKTCTETCGIYNRDCAMDYCDTKYPTSESERTECFNSCTNICPIDECDDREFITAWCEAHSSEYRFESKESCINYCDCSASQGEAIYRPINLYNPFPSSELSGEHGYDVGNRKIGKNWIGYEAYISEDAGEVSNGTASEYEVVLTPTALRQINADTDAQYLPYNTLLNHSKAASCQLPSSSGSVYKGYCSGFIHDDFRGLFTRIRGVDS